MFFADRDQITKRLDEAGRDQKIDEKKERERTHRRQAILS